MVHAEVVHNNVCQVVLTLSFEILNELQERVRVVAALEHMGEEEAMTNAQSTNDRDRVPSRVRKLHLHSSFDPKPPWLHP